MEHECKGSGRPAKLIVRASAVSLVVCPVCRARLPTRQSQHVPVHAKPDRSAWAASGSVRFGPGSVPRGAANEGEDE